MTLFFEHKHIKVLVSIFPAFDGRSNLTPGISGAHEPKLAISLA